MDGSVWSSTALFGTLPVFKSENHVLMCLGEFISPTKKPKVGEETPKLCRLLENSFDTQGTTTTNFIVHLEQYPVSLVCGRIFSVLSVVWYFSERNKSSIGNIFTNQKASE